MPLGLFLEVGIACRDVAASLAWYEALGFVEAATGEAWQHPYAVVTDGRVTLGLHGAEFEGPLPTWVAPGLRARLDELAGLGLECEDVRLDDLALHVATLRGPAGQRLRLVEARTYSPPSLPAGYETRLGYFEEIGLGVDEPEASASAWERLGFVAFGGDDTPPARVVVTSRDLNLGLHAAPLAAPLLCFSATDLPARLEWLRGRGLAFARSLPRGLECAGAALLLAPDDVKVLLLPQAS